MNKEQFLKFIKNPLWIIVILLIVIIFLLRDISKELDVIQGQLWEIEDGLRGIYGQIGFKPSIGDIWKDTLENKLIEIQSELQEIYNLLR